MVDAERVIEACVDGARVDEIGEPQLLDPAQALEGGRVDEPQGPGLEPDVVPDGVADDGHDAPQAGG